ncbi:hypothetical protein HRE53_09715 [Acaryochloris sp. 'Moss Beach']|uniref:hypothetical protein n=1 Tax=Acaryochloris sp. 'Moss Beach' TaxID=2740837 RepID=UPI001F32BE50|nr:hypothetical protein [Acaryochloris sp. 'Moss Beach']UJB71242.1 hypothetical protein HRE53_09715 [Acaryochloris sp. 'Moss Beach']
MAQLLRWIAELVRQRNWYMLLVLVGVGLALLTHFGRDQLNQFIKPEYQTAFSFFAMGWGGVDHFSGFGVCPQNPASNSAP